MAALASQGEALFNQANQLHLAGCHRESVEAFKQAYTLLSSYDGIAWICLFNLSNIFEEHRHVANSSDAAFFRTIQTNPRAPTLHRAISASCAGLICYMLGDREAVVNQLRRIVSLCEKLTNDELDSQICVGMDPATRSPEMVTVRAHLEDPESFLSLAKKMMHERITGVRGEGSSGDFRQQMVMVGQMSEERRAFELPRLQTARGPTHVDVGQKCDECLVSGRNERVELVCSLKKCQRCLSKYYCSPECQRAAWGSGHKKMCRAPGDFVKFDLVRVHGLKNERYTFMNGNMFEIRGPAPALSTSGEARWIVSYLGGGKEVIMKPSNLTRVMFKEERWNWEGLADES
ncbi:hypothetical protein HDU98_009794 [Podochytrium sp. JEL0797]|nr:hypothetical protein HDU98_009794 [Podochytrium sp. JEL0797]